MLAQRTQLAHAKTAPGRANHSRTGQPKPMPVHPRSPARQHGRSVSDTTGVLGCFDGDNALLHRQHQLQGGPGPASHTSSTHACSRIPLGWDGTNTPGASLCGAYTLPPALPSLQRAGWKPGLGERGVQGAGGVGSALPRSGPSSPVLWQDPQTLLQRTRSPAPWLTPKTSPAHRLCPGQSARRSSLSPSSHCSPRRT